MQADKRRRKGFAKKINEQMSSIAAKRGQEKYPGKQEEKHGGAYK